MSGRHRGLLYLGYGLLVALVITGALLVITRRPVGQPVQLQPAPTPAPVRVDVTGAVVAPGVYSLPPGSIVQDALAAAGGATARADISLLNLAHRLTDGEQVVVPELAPTAAATTTGGAPGASTPAPRSSGTTAPSSANRLNINTASVDQLVALPHIGPALAQRIVDYRAAHGAFRAIEDVMQVAGIGPAIFADIKDLIAVN